MVRADYIFDGIVIYVQCCLYVVFIQFANVVIIRKFDALPLEDNFLPESKGVGIFCGQGFLLRYLIWIVGYSK